MRKISVLLLIVTFISSCGSQTRKSWGDFCTNNIWKEQGYYDATHALSYKMMNVYKEKCGEAFDKHEMNLYQFGFFKGVKEFCTYENGFKLGNQNVKNPRSCPFELSEQFNKGFKAGKANYLRTQNLVREQKNQDEREGRLRKDLREF